MKAYKKFSTAKKKANGLPIIKCGEFYIVGMRSTDEVAIIDNKTGTYGSHITMKNLSRLGNGNWAKPDERFIFSDNHPCKELYQ